MGAVGSATLDFGALSANTLEAKVVVTGLTGILAASKVEAWLRVVATAEHSADEVSTEDLNVEAGTIVAGTGFTISGAPRFGRTYGTYTIDWVWN